MTLPRTHDTFARPHAHALTAPSSRRFWRGVAAIALSLATLTLPTASHAQSSPSGEAEQQALRARWRPTIDLGLRLSFSEGLSVNGASMSWQEPLSPSASVGFAMFRAVLPALDLGARIGLAAPETSELLYASTTQTCPAEYFLTYGDTPIARGATLDVTLGLRARVFGAATPFHLTAGAGLGLRALAPINSERWSCVRFLSGGERLQAPAQGEPRGFGVYPALAAHLGYEAHFGVREEFGLGAEMSLHHDGMLSSSLVFRALYAPSSGPALPDAARSRGTRAAIWTLVGTSLVVLSGVALLQIAAGAG